MTRSKPPSLSCAVERQNEALAVMAQERLGWLCRHPSAHARFLNTLSLMEHIGSRKIIASQAGERLTGDTLRHLAEETRHAHFFKRWAEKIARKALGYAAAETIAGAEARGYMGRLDANITSECGRSADAGLPYLYMSLIVELRAVWFYRLYQAVLDEHATGISLKSVLAEEELHLDAMLARLTETDEECSARMGRFQESEQQRFHILWDAVEAECARLVIAVA